MRGTLTSVCAAVVLFVWGCSPAWTLGPQATVGATATQTAATAGSSAGTVVPRLVQFSGTAVDASGKAATGAVAITFSLYAFQDGGAPLWSETQSLTLDSQGHYTAFLGAASADGLPLDLFTSGSARWLGVAPAVPGIGEQPRVLLVGVPYALKAADADTLGGKPASAFVTTDAGAVAPALRAGSWDAASNSAQVKAKAQTSGSTVTGTGTTNYIPLWTGSTTLGNSALFQTTAGLVGIGTATPTSSLQVNGATPIYSTGSGAGLAFQDRAGSSNASGEWYSTGNVDYFWRSDKGNVLSVTSAGNVGIGTTGPTNTLQVNGATPIYSTGSGAGLEFQDRAGGSAASGEWYSTGNVDYFWRSDKGNVLSVTSAGSFGIGTATPAATLEVNGTAVFDQAVTFAASQTFSGPATFTGNSSGNIATVTQNGPGGSLELTSSGSGLVSTAVSEGVVGEATGASRVARWV